MTGGGGGGGGGLSMGRRRLRVKYINLSKGERLKVIVS